MKTKQEMATTQSYDAEDYALSLIDFCGGELTKENVDEYFKIHHSELSLGERHFIIWIASFLLN